ncbi:hypothetical protein GCM10007358_14050 [Phocicoccus schoeneichii]|uniref:restriction endonuclease subunit S n=1 Tax=Phocicoccus schoeneichii TaxID=1812261 RepID=UPI0019991E84|nr:restriction endonuclease subunit S [Jeotgalicoccus schoeneichii]GGH54065.1 hypothetical protein GCM10007358_14050 [Jeotgalicoccus schoeneichii]
MTRKMKDSGIEWIGEIPEDWEINKLKNFFSFSKGKNAAKYTKEYVNEKGKYPVYSGQTLNEGILGYVDQYEYDIDECLFTTTVGAKVMTLNILKGKFTLSQNCLIMNKKKDLNINFFYFLIQGLFDYEKSRIPSFMQPSLRIEDLNSYKIILPSNKEQNLVVNLLEKKANKIDNIIYNTQQSIEELKKYKQSLITEAVTKGLDPNVEMKDSGIEWIGKIPKHWSINRIKNKFTLNKGLTITKSDLKDKGIPVINYGEIHSKYGFRFDTKIHTVKNVDEEYLIKNENSLIEKGDFIFADTSEDLDGSGNFTCYIGDAQCFAGSHTVVLKPRKNINHLYYSYLFESLAFRAQIQKKVQGIKVFSITQGILKPLTLIIPTEHEQQQIVSYLDEQTSRIDKLIADKTKVIEELESYKKSLIYEYVTGKKEV